jgi:hypothetical protein
MISGQLLICSSVLSASSSAVPDAPLVVDQNSHIIVMEYEAWFGPNAVTFQGTAALPLLQSADLQRVGGGYDSADPAVIQQHVTWLEHLGVDAAISEVTNNVSCIFNSEAFAKKYLPYCTPSFRVYNQNIRDNTGNLYPAWTELGTRLKLIPLLGGFDQVQGPRRQDFGAERFSGNAAITGLEAGAQGTASSGAFSTDAILFGKWRD